MELNLDLLKELCLVAGAPGQEERVRKIVLREVAPLVDEIKIDPMGNIIATKKGKEQKKVMAAAHMDEIGFIITHLDDKGFARFHTLGGFDPKTLTSQRVIVHGKKDLIGVLGSKPIHIMDKEDRGKAPRLKDFFIDFGMPYHQVKELVSVGDFVTRERDLVEIGDCVSTKSLDDRVCVFILIEALRQLGTPTFDFYAVFTVQEEIGMRGAQVSSRSINPDFGFGLDVTIANDLPGVGGHETITRIGEGTAIKLLDSSVISDTRMVTFMKKIASHYNITFQEEILTAGGTDTAAIQRSGEGAIVGCISVPTRHIHSTVEMCHKNDILQSIQLLSRCVENMDQFSYDWVERM
ncbi:MAG: M42 family metallopeptidase [Bacteroidota bacterium]